MKKTILLFIVFAFVANVSAQLKVNSSGNVGIGTTTPLHKLHVTGNTSVTGNIYLGGTTSNFLGTTGNVPIIFKVNNSTLAGFTGHSGDDNVSFGYGSFPNALTTGYANTSIGYEALKYNTTGGGNTANGTKALYSNMGGISNIATGVHALYSNTEGNCNVATGNDALYSNLTGSHNIATGYGVLYRNKGSYNIATGFGALSENTSGANNVAIGCLALWSNATGSNNTAIGYNADVSTSNLSNVTVIGNGARVTASNQVVIGNSAVTKASIGTSVFWSTTSDGRIKKNIQANVPGLSFINQLQPITYSLDLDIVDELLKSDDPKINAFNDSLLRTLSPEAKEIMAQSRANKEKQIYSGFIAQDVEKAAHSVGYDFNGVDAPENGKGPYGLRYAEFVVPLVKAVQELSEQNDAKDAAIASLQEQVNELTGLVYQLLGKEPNELRSGSMTGLEDASSDGASLQQNIPNPFNQSTEIRYTLPKTCHSAQIVIVNTAGRMMQQIPLSISNEKDSIMIESGSLSAGIYLYSLICDGKLVDTKRMILTE